MSEARVRLSPHIPGLLDAEISQSMLVRACVGTCTYCEVEDLPFLPIRSLRYIVTDCQPSF